MAALYMNMYLALIIYSVTQDEVDARELDNSARFSQSNIVEAGITFPPAKGIKYKSLTPA